MTVPFRGVDVPFRPEPALPGPWAGAPSLWLLRVSASDERASRDGSRPEASDPEASDLDDADLDVSCLDADERSRAAAFVRDSDRNLYLTAHIALRKLLGANLDVPPGEVRFTREPCAECGGPHGRPVLAGLHSPLHFSLSHCEGLVLIGTAAGPVGVDVERVPDPDAVDSLAKELHPGERADLAAVPAGARAEAFCRVWARKEAYLKGIGVGLTRALDADYVGDRPRHGAAHPSGWHLHSLDLGPHRGTHAAAVALREPAPPVLHVLPDTYAYARQHG
ncbi:4'-phosphopantetheinyl transferase superfamily protein [Streptomyces sp. NPDC046821]|uniref:4'-phosphopantetheinyl transferase family protein n=1 Tax=Streptomyces sp. NPDC046821 TaxID=3154702 RepID=UPI00340746E4